MAAICDLLSHFLLHARVADYSITHQTVTEVTDLMQHTLEVLKPCLSSQLVEVSSCWFKNVTHFGAAGLLQLFQTEIIINVYCSNYHTIRGYCVVELHLVQRIFPRQLVHGDMVVLKVSV